MSFISVHRRLVAYSFALTIAVSFPLATLAQRSSHFSSGISNGASEILIARGGGRGGGGARGGGGGARMSRPSGGAGRSSMGSHSMSRPSSGIRSTTNRSSTRHPSNISRAGSPSHGHAVQQPNRGGVNAARPHPSQPISGQAQRPNVGQRPGNQPNRPNNINDINASRNVNVEGNDGGWGYTGENYPWGLGAAAGLTGFALGSVMNTLPADAEPVVIQGQSYYESNGMYLEPSTDGNYRVVPPPAGAIEPQLPSGAKPVEISGHTLYEVEGVYYQPTIQNGQQVYMVVTP